MDIRRIVLIHPGWEGLFLGRAPGAPYTLMRLASLVPPRHDAAHAPRKLFGSFSTDYGFRPTFAWRNVEDARLLNAWRSPAAVHPRTGAGG